MNTYQELLEAYSKIKNNEMSEEDYHLMVKEFQFEVYDAGYTNARSRCSSYAD